MKPIVLEDFTFNISSDSSYISLVNKTIFCFRLVIIFRDILATTRASLDELGFSPSKLDNNCLHSQICR